MRLFRQPSLHFVAIGVALFALERYTAAPLPGTPQPMLVITAERVAEARAQRPPATPKVPSPDDQGVVEGAVDDEILYREALARGLDRYDPAVHGRLIEKARFLVEAEGGTTSVTDDALYRKAIALGLDRDDALVRGILVRQMRLLLKRSNREPAPDDAALRAYLDRHLDEYVEPARVSLWHVFVARDRRGDALEDDARALLARLRSDSVGPVEALRLGDAFPPGGHLQRQSQNDLARLFGAEFARAAVALEPGTWVGPLRSAYGLHLVRIEAKEPGRPAPFEAVRSRILAQLVDERNEAHLREALRILRTKYSVRVEAAAGGPG